MKPTELMINDWVLLADGSWSQVSQIEENCIRVSGLGSMDVFEFEPVPLTTDILIANGFVLTAVGDHGKGTPKRNINRYESWTFSDKWQTFNVMFDRLTKRFCLNAFGNHFESIESVHQLQHAMRLCGIKKIIVL